MKALVYSRAVKIGVSCFATLMSGGTQTAKCQILPTTSITGSSGFIGGHLVCELEENGYDVVKCGFRESNHTIPMDLMNPESVQRVIERYEPDVIINLAGQANVGLSWSQPQRTLQLSRRELYN